VSHYIIYIKGVSHYIKDLDFGVLMPLSPNKFFTFPFNYNFFFICLWTFFIVFHSIFIWTFFIVIQSWNERKKLFCIYHTGLCSENISPWYSWNIAESGVKHKNQVKSCNELNQYKLDNTYCCNLQIRANPGRIGDRLVW
jgi:hypothetical protein